MKGLWISVLAVALGMVSTARASVPAHCKGSGTAIQRLYCMHPALRAMHATVRTLSVSGAASAQARQAARRDQQLWLARRDDVLWTMLANPTYPRADVVRRAWQLERSRQAFLLGRDGQGARLAAPLSRLAKTLRAHPPGTGDPLATWAAHDARVIPARDLHDEGGSVSELFARADLHPDLALRLKVNEMADGQSALDLLWLPESGLGAVVSVQGTAACRYMTWFRTGRGGVAHPTPAPMLDRVPCGRSHLTLLRVGYQSYVALAQSTGADAVDVSMQAWLGERWASPARMRLRFDHALVLSQLRCTGGDCARFVPAVRRIVADYDLDPQGRQLAGPAVRADERDRAATLLHLARKGRGTVLARMPLAGNEPLRELCQEASVFLVRVKGRLLLGRIGHGHLGWRRADGWRVGLWDVKDGRLVPVASAVVRRPRGKLLAVAAMPPEVVASR